MTRFASAFQTLILFSIVVLTACKKDNNDDDGRDEPKGPLPVIETAQPFDITKNSATSGGAIGADNGFLVTARGVCWDTDGDPTIDDDKTSDGQGVGGYLSEMTDLSPSTTYFVRAYATNENGTAYGSAFSFTTKREAQDGDGNNYETVVIGNQVWFAENLKTTKYNDGTPISLVEFDWQNTNSPAYCWYDNNRQTYEDDGALYNWYVVNPSSNGGKNPCPQGWHVPTSADWGNLESYLSQNGFSGKEGEALKSTVGWANSGNGTDDFGFSAYPTNYRFRDGSFQFQNNEYADWWTSSDSLGSPIFRYLFSDNSFINEDPTFKELGLCIRCIQD